METLIRRIVELAAAGAAYTLRDDDDTAMPRLPDCGLLAAKFAPAYVEPYIVPVGDQFDGNYVVDMGATFVLNIKQEKEKDACDAVRVVQADPMFWSVQVLSAFQSEMRNDGDPDTEWPIYAGSTPNDPLCYDCVLIFLEPIREEGGAVLLEKACVVHEVGHTFQCLHEHGGIMSPEDLHWTAVFQPVSLDAIRDAIKPGQ